MARLSSPASRRRKRLILQFCFFSVAAATLLLAVFRPRLALFLVVVACGTVYARGRTSSSLGLVIGVLLAAIAVAYVLSMSSGDEQHTRMQLLQHKRQAALRFIIGFTVIGYSLILFPRQIWNGLKYLMEIVMPSNAFGLIDQKTYERVAEETTEAELEALRNHLALHGAPSGLSERATSRLRSFTNGFMGISRAEAIAWLVRAAQPDSFAGSGETNESSFTIGPDGRRIDHEPDESSDLDEDDQHGCEGEQEIDEDEPTTASNLSMLRRRVFG